MRQKLRGTQAMVPCNILFLCANPEMTLFFTQLPSHILSTPQMGMLMQLTDLFIESICPIGPLLAS